MTVGMNRLKERFDQLMATSPKKKGGKADEPGGFTSQVVDLVLEQAIVERSSDVHIEPDEGRVRIRYRIDGRLYEVLSIEESLNLPVITRIEVMSGLQTDAMMKRKAQDGRFSMRIAASNYDFRVATFPTIRGEKMAIRILTEDLGLYDIKNVGLDDFDDRRIDKLLQHRSGLLLVCGPTGSGKTTTLYSILSKVNSPKLNIVTLEDPVEFRMPGMNQCDIKTRSDFKFADGLRSILRQDPDIILVGEIRDKETAEIALRAAMTGHLVLSSLHANNAIGTIIRLVNMGLEPYMVSYAMVGAIAQRLVRRICSQCKSAYSATPEVIHQLKDDYNIDESMLCQGGKLASAGLKGHAIEPGMEGPVFYKGEGCEYCQGTGYRGRVGIFEIISFNDELRSAILKGQTAESLMSIAQGDGTKSLAIDGMAKVKSGQTTLDEIYAVLVEH